MENRSLLWSYISAESYGVSPALGTYVVTSYVVTSYALGNLHSAAVPGYQPTVLLTMLQIYQDRALGTPRSTRIFLTARKKSIRLSCRGAPQPPAVPGASQAAIPWLVNQIARM